MGFPLLPEGKHTSTLHLSSKQFRGHPHLHALLLETALNVWWATERGCESQIVILFSGLHGRSFLGSKKWISLLSE